MRRLRKLGLVNLAGGLAYCAVLHMTNRLAGSDRSPLDASLATGIAVSAVVLAGPWALPGAMAGAVAAIIGLGWGLGYCFVIPFSAAATALLAAWLLKRCRLDHSLRQLQDVNRFLVWGALAPNLAISLPSVALTVLVCGGGTAGLMSKWATAVVLASASTLVIGSFVLVLSTVGPREVWSWRWARLVAATVALIATSVVLFSGTAILATAQLLIMLLLATIYGQAGAVCGGIVLALADPLPPRSAWLSFGQIARFGPVPPGTLFVSAATLAALLVAAAFSERRASEVANKLLRQTAQQLVDAQDLGEIGSFVVDPDMGWGEFTERASLITGIEQHVTQDGRLRLGQLACEEERAAVNERFRTLMEARETGVLEFRMDLAGRGARWIEVRVRFEPRDADDRSVLVYGTVQDVSARKIAEMRADHLFNNAPYPILVVDDAGDIVRSSLAAQRLFALDEAAIEGKRIDDLLTVVHSFDDADKPWYLGVVPDGAVAGVELIGKHADGSTFLADARVTELLTNTGMQHSIGLRDITKRRALTEQLTYAARHDPLTRLPNRAMFVVVLEQALKRACRSPGSLAVIFVDLDNFKAVNDGSGHAAGDMALTELAGRLQRSVRDGDLVARFGGDEFVILCENVVNADEAQARAQRLVECVANEPFDIGGRSQTLTLSAGLLMVDDPGNKTVESVMQAADAAMYEAKASGKHGVAVVPSPSPGDVPASSEGVGGEKKSEPTRV